ncbi:WD40-repeat-containing domain [Trinorchestia longiramus]|nr:WD40-repeat-containing domain [Trinorchestia longiramus]
MWLLWWRERQSYAGTHVVKTAGVSVLPASEYPSVPFFSNVAVQKAASLCLLPRLLAPVHGAPRAGIGQDLKRFSVSSLLTAPITSLAWSSNGLRLVSGDAAGTVALLEVDHDCCQCIARHLFCEEEPVTQLSYWKQRVAASTEERCVVYSLHTEELSAVGTKPRKQKGRFGVTWSRRGLKDSVAGVTDNTAETPDNTAGTPDNTAGTPDNTAGTLNNTAGTLNNTAGTPNSTAGVTDNTAAVNNAEKIPGSEVPVGSLSSDSAQPKAPVVRQRSSAVEDSVLYTSCPGLLVWVAHSSGLVQTTLLIKDLPDSVRINVSCIKSENKVPPVIKFEKIEVLDTGQLVIYSDDSLVIFNPITLLVEAFLHSENFIRDISSTKSSIFILAKTGKLFCLSCESLKIGSSAILRSGQETKNMARSGTLLSPDVLKKFGRKMFTQSSSVLDSVLKLSGVIANRVSETASRDTIITGISEQDLMLGENLLLDQTHSPLADKRFFSNYHLSGSDLNTAIKQSLVPCSMTQSVSGTLPAPHLPESEASSHRMTQSLCNYLQPSQLTNDEGNVQKEALLLVVREAPTRRRHRRQQRPSSEPENRHTSKSPSQIDLLQNDTTSHRCGSTETDSTAAEFEFSVEESDRRLGEMLGIDCMKNSGSAQNNHYSNGTDERRLNVGQNPLKNRDRRDTIIGHNASELLTLLCSQEASSRLESITSDLCYGPPSGSSVPSIHSLLFSHQVGTLERVDQRQNSLEESVRHSFGSNENFQGRDIQDCGDRLRAYSVHPEQGSPNFFHSGPDN